MKFTLGTALALLAVTIALVASMAQAYTCSNLSYESASVACFSCCKRMGLQPGKGRAIVLSHGEHKCKCITEEEFQAQEKKRREQVE